MKKMREHEEKEQKNLEFRIIDVVFINNTQDFTFKNATLYEATVVRLLPVYKEDYSYNPIFTIFHPPLV